MFIHFCCLFAKTLLNQRSGGGTPYTGLYGEAPPERGAFSKLVVYERVGKIASCCSSSCKVEEMVAKAKYIKGCHILAEMTSQLNQNDSKPGKNVAITGSSIVLAHP